ncbi:CBS and ACT domain-containing protein [Desulfospira joergensenii]|uniref:CBS and ACT domain-containing protein n=1 Tax=Desulfospira joergensenii TaxID=53329 RepID=UPI0003B5178C|nr:CBS and ACT domain-containing protein [Desulfospira joergensenii]
MLIKDWMSKSVVTIDPKDSMNDAAKLFRTRVISMLPVINSGKITGVITDGDIKKAMPSDATTLDQYEIRSLMDSVEIGSIMSRPVITIDWDQTIDEAAGLMLGNGISGLPVVDHEEKLRGVITKSDIFRCFVSFTGVANKGQIFSFKLQDRPGTIKLLTDMVRGSGGRLCSIMTSYDDIEEGFRKVVFHTFDIDPEKFDSLVERFLQAGELNYVADLSRNFRKLY